MIDAPTYLTHIRADGDRIAAAADGSLDRPVPSCPGNTVGSLLLHTAAVCMFWADALAQNRVPDSDWTAFPTDVTRAFRQMHARVVAELASRDPDQPTWTWGTDQHVRFAYRRVAQELAVHRWDLENAVGTPDPIEPALAADGVDELFQEFAAPPPPGVDVQAIPERFGGTGQRLRFEATDVPRAWTITADPERFEVSEDGDADVTAQGTASDINLFLWGRVPQSALDVSGDASLLDRWQEKVKI